MSREMIHELLRFTIVRGGVEAFIRRNEEVWTPALRDRPGFIDRTIVRDVQHPERVAILVRWSDREAMEAFPADEHRRLDARMADLVMDAVREVFTPVVGRDSAARA